MTHKNIDYARGADFARAQLGLKLAASLTSTIIPKAADPLGEAMHHLKLRPLSTPAAQRSLSRHIAADNPEKIYVNLMGPRSPTESHTSLAFRNQIMSDAIPQNPMPASLGTETPTIPVPSPQLKRTA